MGASPYPSAFERMRTTHLLVLLLITVASTTIPAATPATDIRQAIERFLHTQASSPNTQTKVEVGSLPSSSRYAACRNWQAFLPPGAQAWGNVSVGVRCTEGGNFSFYVGARVVITGNYLVAARPISLGQIVQPEDVRIERGELTAQGQDLLISMNQVVGRIAKINIVPDRPLLAALFRQDPIIQAGQPVKVISRGNGFSVSNEGQALNSGMLGQTIRVRMPGGNIVSGIIRDKGSVEIAY